MQTPQTPENTLTTLPHRPYEWGRAARALWRMRGKNYDESTINEFAAALEGDDAENDLREFVASPNAERLLRDRPDLPGRLDDHEWLATLPEGSLGRAYLDLARRDDIRIGNFIAARDGLPYDVLPRERRDDLRNWYRNRSLATHDLYHLLTGYDRDEIGEVAIVLFTAAQRPKLVLFVGGALAMLVAPIRAVPRLVGYLRDAWRRGRASRIPLDLDWEECLEQPLDHVRERLGIPPAEEAHPDGIWRVLEDGRWAPCRA